MFCGKCGANIPSGSKKCPGCGQPLRSNEYLGGFQDILRTDISSLQSYRQQGYPVPVQQAPAYTKKKIPVLVIIFAGIAALSLLVNLILGLRLAGKNHKIADLNDTVTQLNDKLSNLNTELDMKNDEIEELSKTPEPVAAPVVTDSISGYVRVSRSGSDNIPLDGIPVRLYLWDHYTYNCIKIIYTDQSGLFAFEDLDEGTYAVSFSPNEGLSLSDDMAQDAAYHQISDSQLPSIIGIDIPKDDNKVYNVLFIRKLELHQADGDED